MVEHSCSKPDSVLQRILTLNSGPGLQNYSLFLCFHSVSNFLSPTFSLTLCFCLSLNKSSDGAPPPFHFPPPDQGLLILVSPCPGPRDPGRLREEPAVAAGSGPGRVNQCFPIRADMHFTRRDSPQPANWFKLFYWLNWCHPFAWSITARRRVFPLSSLFRAAAVHPGQGQVKEPRHRTQRKTTNQAGPLGTGEVTPGCRRMRPARQQGWRFPATAFNTWLKRTHTWPGRPPLWKQSVSELRQRILRGSRPRPKQKRELSAVLKPMASLLLCSALSWKKPPSL